MFVGYLPSGSTWYFTSVFLPLELLLSDPISVFLSDLKLKGKNVSALHQELIKLKQSDY